MSDRCSSSSSIDFGPRVQPRTTQSECKQSDESPIVTRKRKLREDSTSSDSGSEEQIRKRRRKECDAKPVMLSDSDCESESDSQFHDGTACPICLRKMDDTTLQGRPDTCPHSCCLDCITTWSKKNSTCAFCRTPMTSITVILQNNEVEALPVETVSPAPVDTPPDPADLFCQICDGSDEHSEFLICHYCEAAYHIECLNMPWSYAFLDEWSCSVCVSWSDLDDSEDTSYEPDNDW